jgi:hypothetical protein
VGVQQRRRPSALHPRLLVRTEISSIEWDSCYEAGVAWMSCREPALVSEAGSQPLDGNTIVARAMTVATSPETSSIDCRRGCCPSGSSN